MITSRWIVLSMMAAASVMACDKAQSEQRRADNAVIEANEKAAKAQREADEKIATARANEEKTVAEAQGNFSKMHEDYRHGVSTDLIDVDKKIEKATARLQTETGKAKTELEAKLGPVHAQRQVVDQRLRALDAAPATTWDAAKADLDKAKNDLHNLVDKL